MVTRRGMAEPTLSIVFLKKALLCIVDNAGKVDFTDMFTSKIAPRMRGDKQFFEQLHLNREGKFLLRKIFIHIYC